MKEDTRENGVCPVCGREDCDPVGEIEVGVRTVREHVRRGEHVPEYQRVEAQELLGCSVCHAQWHEIYLWDPAYSAITLHRQPSYHGQLAAGAER